MKLIVSFSALIILISACSFQAQSQSQPTDKAQTPETVYGIQVLENTIQFKVKSNGCTKSKDFALSYKVTQSNAFEIELLRNKPDFCRKRSSVMTIKTPLPEIMQAEESLKVILLNPIAKPHQQWLQGKQPFYNHNKS